MGTQKYFDICGAQSTKIILKNCPNICFKKFNSFIKNFYQANFYISILALKYSLFCQNVPVAKNIHGAVQRGNV